MSFLPEGDFKFNGQLHLLATKKLEMVESSSNAGKKRLKELQSQSWACKHYSGIWYQCSAFVKGESLTPQVVSSLVSKYQGMNLTFEEVQGVSLLNDAETMREYEVLQNVQTTQGNSTKYLLRTINGGPNKIQIDFASQGTLYLNAINRKSFTFFETVEVREKMQSTIYAVEVVFSGK